MPNRVPNREEADATSLFKLVYGRGLIVIAVIVLVMLLSSCAAQEAETPSGQAQSSGTQMQAGFWRQNWREQGAEIYWKNCAGCHGIKGEGAPGIYPPLAGSPLVTGPHGPMLMPTMFGRGAMPGFTGLLDDEEMAMVLSYIRTAWGNNAEPISPAQVAEFRHDDSEVTQDPFAGVGGNVGGLTGGGD